MKKMKCSKGHRYLDATPTEPATYIIVPSQGPYSYRRCLICKSADDKAHIVALERQKREEAMGRARKDRAGRVTTGFYAPITEIGPAWLTAAAMTVRHRVPEQNEQSLVLNILGLS